MHSLSTWSSFTLRSINLQVGCFVSVLLSFFPGGPDSLTQPGLPGSRESRVRLPPPTASSAEAPSLAPCMGRLWGARQGGPAGWCKMPSCSRPDSQGGVQWFSRWETDEPDPEAEAVTWNPASRSLCWCLRSPAPTSVWQFPLYVRLVMSLRVQTESCPPYIPGAIQTGLFLFPQRPSHEL